MPNLPFDELKARLDEHASLANPDRQKFLDEACGPDEGLRRLASLLYDEKFSTRQAKPAAKPKAKASPAKKAPAKKLVKKGKKR